MIKVSLRGLKINLPNDSKFLLSLCSSMDKKLILYIKIRKQFSGTRENIVLAM